MRLSSPDAFDGDVVSTSTQEVGVEVPRLVGLTRQQFVQTVVLPQGEFAEFLRSTGEQRRLVLQSLFGTEIYERTTDQLVEGRKAANAAIAVAEAAVRDALARLQEATADDTLDVTSADAVLDTITEEARVASTAHLTAQTQRAALATHRDDRAARHRAVVRRSALRAQQARLDERRDEVEAARERLAAAVRAAAVAGPVAAAERAATRAADAARLLEVALDDLRRDRAELAHELGVEQAVARDIDVGAASPSRGSASPPATSPPSTSRPSPSRPSLSRPSPAVVRDRHDATSAELARLTEAARLEQALPGRRTQIDRAEATLAESLVDLQRLDGELAARPVRRAELVAHRDVLQAEAASVPEAERLVDEQAQRLDRIIDLTALDDSVESASAAVRQSSAGALAAIEAETDLRRRKILGMAGELAAGLAAGEPCAVCGSRDHPAPARATDDHPTDDAIDAATEARQRAEATAASHGVTHATAVERRDAARTALGDATRAQIDEQLADARRRLDAARSSGAELTAAGSEVVRYDTETEGLRARLEAHRVARAAAEARLESDRAALTADERRVDDAVGDRAESVAALVEVLTDEADVVAHLSDALAGDEQAAAEWAVRRAERDAALAEQSFAGVDAADEAALPEETRREIAATVREFDRESDVVGAGLAEAEVIAVGPAGTQRESAAALGADVDAESGQGTAAGADSAIESGAELGAEPGAGSDTGLEPDPDDSRTELDAAESAVAAADEALAEAAGVEARASERARRTGAAHRALTAALARGDAAVERARAAVRMADLASASSGVNTKGVTLGTYVLLRRFDDVVAAANVRLTVMSSGRYALQASEERESGSRSRKTGLALAIRDHTTDTVRDPKSFSGGETFYASLSLALGLADVVQAEAGGLDLGTLFVDEGFGTLDPETLDAVMTELGRLSASGRVVGIVSHVDELKQRIADRIEVRRQPDGSSTLRSTV